MTLQEKGDFIQFGAESPGIYVAVSIPKVERLEVPVQGCLYSAKINRQISLRFPKKTTDMDMTCDIRVSAMIYIMIYIKDKNSYIKSKNKNAT